MKIAKQGILLLMIAMFVFILAACSGGSTKTVETDTPAVEENKPGTDVAGNEPKEEPVKEEPAAENSDEWTMDFDLGGREVVVTAWWDIVFGDSPPHQEIKANIEELQKKHNFTIKFVTTPYASMKEQATSSALSGEPFADVVRLERRALFPGMVSSGLITPLDEVIDFSGPAGKYIDPMIKDHVGTFGGHLYGFEKTYTDFSGIYYNKQMLKDAGIKDLHDYVAEDNWNWETLQEIVGKVTKGDTYGLAGTELAVTTHAVVSNGSNLLDVDKGKEMLSDPRTVEALTFAQELSGKSMITNDQAAIKTLFTQGKILMYVGFQWEGEGFINDLGEDLGFVQFPVGPKGDGYKSVSNPPNYWTILKGTENAEEIFYIMAKIWDITPTEEYKGQDRLEKYFADEKDIEAAKMMMEPPQYTVMNHDLFPDWNVYQMLTELYAEKLAPATIVETHRQVLQAVLDDAL
ncbi:ABC transporter substrate-binding protein [Paenibacillus lautus]|uniref:ABC transporter substrate-binding protein n=1 Tax=Paenibacillus lautus TaxID=1401 RepID=UPI002DB84461|nr:extracellular solute-binding protein [Paenibacillus lautus]MEC0259595.1 extracellular solute-binding protein [Paenibacillus lautus]